MAAAEAGFDDGDVDAVGGELGQGGCREHLELRGSEPLRGRPHTTEGPLDVGVPLPHADALGPARDMGRRVTPGEQSLTRQNRRGRAGRGRLAVRPDHVDRGVLELRVAELRKQREHAAEPESVRGQGEGTRASRR